MVGDELLAYSLHIQRLHASAAWLGLNQHDRAQVLRARPLIGLGQFFQRITPGDGIAQTLLPVRFRLQHHGQLDHLLRLQLGRRDAVQHVRGSSLKIRCRGQLHHAAGAEAGQHIEGQFRSAVVRFVHDHKRPPQSQHISQRIGHRLLAALSIGQQLGPLNR